VVTPRADKITIEELVEQLFQHYALNCHKSDDKHRWTKHLSPFFAKTKAADVSPILLKQHIEERKPKRTDWARNL
jgi:hypothetical protein